MHHHRVHQAKTLRAATIFACVFQLPACAQTVWLVDGQNRAGAHFIDLPAAVAAASPGDVLRVRSDGGSYSAFATSKPLTICADIGQAIMIVSPTSILSVTNLPSASQFTMRGFLIGSNPGGPVVQVSNCAGRVAWIGCEVGIGAPSMQIQSCGGVLLQDCRVLGGFPAVAASASTVVIQGGQLQGRAGDDRFNQLSGVAVSLQSSSAVLSACQLTGGLGRGVIAPSAALEMIGSSADAGTVSNGLGSMRAGAPGLLGAGAAPAVVGQSSSLRLDPAFTLAASGGAPSIQGVTTTNAVFPGLLLDTSHASFANLFLRPMPNAAQLLVFGPPADPRSIAGVGGLLWLDPNAMFVAFETPQSVVVPPIGYGSVLCGHVVALTTNGIELSDVAMLVVR